jgi:hypothetical protein
VRVLALVASQMATSSWSDAAPLTSFRGDDDPTTWLVLLVLSITTLSPVPRRGVGRWQI